MRKSWLVSLVLLACLGLSGTVGATTTSVAQTASHGHTLTLQCRDSTGGSGQPILEQTNEQWYNLTYTANNTGASSAHTHSLAANTNVANNQSPYYALAYIMRCA